MKRAFLLIAGLGLIVNPPNVFCQDKPQIFIQTGHLRGIRAVDFSGNGRYIASGANDQTVKLWDVETGEELRTFTGHQGWIKGVMFSPDDKYILSNGEGPMAKLWEAETGRLIKTFKGFYAYDFHEFDFSPDSKSIVTADYENLIIWDTAEGGELKKIAKKETGFTCAAFSPDSKLVVSGDNKGILRVWDAKTGDEVKTIKLKPRDKKKDCIDFVIFTPDGKYIIAILEDRSIYLCDFNRGKQIRTFKGTFTRSIDRIDFSFSPDGKYFLSSNNGRVWDIKRGRLVRSFEKGLPDFTGIDYSVFSADSTRVLAAISRKTLKLWEIKTGDEIETINTDHSREIDCLALSPSGELALTGSADNTLKLWKISNGKLVRTFKGRASFVHEVAFSPDGRYSLSANSDSTVKIWDMRTASEIKILKGHEYAVNSAKFSPDGKRILSGSADYSLRLWDFKNGKEIKKINHGRAITSVEFSPDGKLALSVGDFFYVWDLDNYKEIWRLSHPGRDSKVNDAVFSPDSKEILSAGNDNTLRLWNISSGKERRAFKGPDRAITAVAYSPDGTYALTGDNDERVSLWKIWSGSRLEAYRGHSSDIASVAYSPDGKLGVSGSWDDSIKLWDIDADKNIKTFKGHTDGVVSVVFSPDGKQILSGSLDGTRILWDVSSGKEIAKLISFSDGEWVVITPEGYFNASENGARYVKVRIDNKIYSVDQFYSQFYRPELVQAVVGGSRLAPDKTLAEVTRKSPAPMVMIIAPDPSIVTDKETVDLKLKILDNGGGIGRIIIYLNGTQVSNETRGIVVKGKEIPGQKIIEFRIPLAEGLNKIKVIAFNKDGSMESLPAKATVTAEFKPAKPLLYALIVGIDKYKNKAISLKYSASDALLFSETLKKLAAPLFNKVDITLLTSFEATTKESIQQAFSELTGKVKPNDLFVFYNASHGVIDIVDNKEQYLLLTSDVLLLSSRHLGESALSQGELIRLIGAVPAQKKLIILDTCHAGKGGKEITLALLAGTRGLTESTAIKLLQRAVGSNVFSASSDTQAALEGYQGQGLFTYALVKGLTGAADIDGDGFIKIYELADYVEEQVVILSEEKFKRQQTPIIQTGANFPLGKKVERAK